MNTPAAKYPIGIQSFSKLRENEFTYVDKTGYIRRLVDEGAIYFLGRPRRFGKSLLLSTMHAFFEGKRELFKGLEIDGWDEWDWAEYPVLHFDLNAKNYTYRESLYERLGEQLSEYEAIYDVKSPDSSLDGRFRALISAAVKTTGRKVVVLVDEYDKPILDVYNDDAMVDYHRDTLRAFYATIKSADANLRFCFLTGVTKFGQLNIFSGLNNLEDISISNDYAGICGITDDELHRYFAPGVDLCAREWGCTVDEAYGQLKSNYDGYHFSPSLLDVYNPWSVLNAIKQRMIGMYWNSTGGGLSFLYRLFSSGQILLNELDGASVAIGDLQGTTIDSIDPITILYQSGYLTIESYAVTSQTFILKFPNSEVKRGFVTGLLPYLSGETPRVVNSTLGQLINSIVSGDIDRFMESMQAFFADIPYENAVKSERDFQNIMYAITAVLGLQTQLERHSARGSADMVIQTPDYICIFEFKVDRSPEEALEQIDRKGYAAPFATDTRRLIKVGVEFSLEARNITRWVVN